MLEFPEFQGACAGGGAVCGSDATGAGAGARAHAQQDAAPTFPTKPGDGDHVYDVAVIGAGPAGMTAAMYCARAGLDCAMVESLSPGGQLAQTEHLENYPGYNTNTSGFDLADIMFSQAESFGAKTVYDQVTGVDFDLSPKRVDMSFGTLWARAIIVATGARPAKLGLKGEEALTGAGVSYCATCDGNFFKGKVVCVVGGGDTAVADAIYLSRICEKVYIIVRRDVLRATAIYNDRLAELSNVEIIWNSVVDSIESADGRVSAINIKPSGNACTDGTDGACGRKIDTSALFIAVGTVPNVEFLDGKLELDEVGRIVAGEMGKTSVPGVFAAGDVRTKHLRQVSTAIADGANCAESAAEYLMRQ